MLKKGDVLLKHVRDSIARIGQTTPIIVTKMRDGRYKIFDGNRRLRALKQLGETTIKAVNGDNKIIDLPIDKVVERPS